MRMSSKQENRLSREENRRTMRRILHFIRPYLIFVITGLLCAVVSVVTQLLVPIFCGDAIDAMIGAGRVDFASVIRIVWQLRWQQESQQRRNGYCQFVITESFSAFPVICEIRQLGRSRHCRFPIWTAAPPARW